MEVSLTVTERVVLGSVIPQEGDITSLKIIRKLQSDLGFTEQENEDLGFKQENGNFGWDNTKETIISIDIGRKGMEIIVNALSKASDEGRLHISWLPIYERFVEDLWKQIKDE